MKKKDPNKYPKGLNAAKVRAIIDYYDHQTDDEAAAEILAAKEAPMTWMRVPTRLVPSIRKLIERRRKTA